MIALLLALTLLLEQQLRLTVLFCSRLVFARANAIAGTSARRGGGHLPGRFQRTQARALTGSERTKGAIAGMAACRCADRLLLPAGPCRRRSLADLTRQGLTGARGNARA